MNANETLAALESLLTSDENLQLWRSHKDSGRKLFYVWQTRRGHGLAKGKPTLAEAIVAFKEQIAEADGEYRAATMKPQ